MIDTVTLNCAGQTIALECQWLFAERSRTESNSGNWQQVTRAQRQGRQEEG